MGRAHGDLVRAIARLTPPRPAPAPAPGREHAAANVAALAVHAIDELLARRVTGLRSFDGREEEVYRSGGGPRPVAFPASGTDRCHRSTCRPRLRMCGAHRSSPHTTRAQACQAVPMLTASRAAAGTRRDEPGAAPREVVPRRQGHRHFQRIRSGAAPQRRAQPRRLAGTAREHRPHDRTERPGPTPPGRLPTAPAGVQTRYPTYLTGQLPMRRLPVAPGLRGGSGCSPRRVLDDHRQQHLRRWRRYRQVLAVGTARTPAP